MTANTSEAAALEMLTEAEAAALLRLSPETLSTYRKHPLHIGRGPAYVQRGKGRVLYLKSDLAAWIAANRHDPAEGRS